MSTQLTGTAIFCFTTMDRGPSMPHENQWQNSPVFSTNSFSFLPLLVMFPLSAISPKLKLHQQ